MVYTIITCIQLFKYNIKEYHGSCYNLKNVIITNFRYQPCQHNFTYSKYVNDIFKDGCTYLPCEVIFW